MQKNLNSLKYYYSLSAVFITIALFLINKDLSKAFFCASCAWVFYIYMLGFNFQVLFMGTGLVKDEDKSNVLKILAIFFSSLRMALIAGIFTIFILKFKLNLIGLFASFLLYKLVLFLVGLNYATHQRRNSRQNS
jgi:hypothetical protein